MISSNFKNITKNETRQKIIISDSVLAAILIPNNNKIITYFLLELNNFFDQIS